MRHGLNDVFRSLARRSQSLLHRQLTLLDQMERRASDPEALDDLFRLDHLTTRMRRHAEGLVILAGGPPGRGWSSPVRMVDVMRGAIAQVEDYARVSVATRSQAALAGSAVADVIHLLAELIENATTLSPPYTSVRVSGDTVANGFAIEVEDRGLGMSPARLAELNDRLANPPEFNPADSEQLGLFVVSQLAKRHGIRVTLKASPYGGTAAIVLIPRHLVVTEEAFLAGLPGEPASAAMAQLTAIGNQLPRPSRCAVRRGSSRSGLTAVRMPRPSSARPTAPRVPGQLTCPGGVTISPGPAPGPERRRRDARQRRALRVRRVHAAARPGHQRDARPGRRVRPGPVRDRAERTVFRYWVPHRIQAVPGERLIALSGAWQRVRVRRRGGSVPGDGLGPVPRGRLSVPWGRLSVPWQAGAVPRQRFPVVSGRRPQNIQTSQDRFPAGPSRHADSRPPDRAWPGRSSRAGRR